MTLTREDIREMAKESGFDWHRHWSDDGLNRLEILVRAAYATGAAAEREAIAKWYAESGWPKPEAR